MRKAARRGEQESEIRLFRHQAVQFLEEYRPVVVEMNQEADAAIVMLHIPQHMVADMNLLLTLLMYQHHMGQTSSSLQLAAIISGGHFLISQKTLIEQLFKDMVVRMKKLAINT